MNHFPLYKIPFYISYSSITKLLTFLRSSSAEASAVLTPFMTSADPPAIETVFCAIFVVPAALSLDAEVIPSIASVISVSYTNLTLPTIA